MAALATYGLSPENLEVVVRTFRTVFPEAFVFNTIRRTDLLLVGTVEPLRIDVEKLERRAGREAVRENLTRVGVEGAAQILARGRLGAAELAELIGAAPGPAALNTDDNAWIEFRAPLDLYRRTRGANEQLIEAFARGLAPYLAADDPETLAAVRSRLAVEYRRLGSSPRPRPCVSGASSVTLTEILRISGRGREAPVAISIDITIS